MMRIVVLEGDRDVRAYLVFLLGVMEHRTAGVGSLYALSRRIARRPPDVIFCDANPPDGDGIGTCRRLQLLWPGLSVVIMTWEQSGVVRARRAALGPVLIKPFSPPELKNALTFPLLSRLNTNIVRVVSDLKAQNDRIRSRSKIRELR